MSHKYLKPILLSFLKAITWGFGAFIAFIIIDQLSVIELNLHEVIIIALLVVTIILLILYARMSKQYLYDVANLNNKLSTLSRGIQTQKRNYLTLNRATKVLTPKEPELILSNEINIGSQIRVIMTSNSVFDGFIRYRSLFSRSIDSLYNTKKDEVSDSIIENDVERVPKWQWEGVVDLSGLWYFVAKLPKGVKQSKVRIEVHQLVPVS